MSGDSSTGDYIGIPTKDEVFDAPIINEPPEQPKPITLPERPDGRAPVSITRVAHSAVLIDFDGTLMLTDPWFTETDEYHHGEALAMGVEQLPRLAAVVASHAHYDHYDIENVARYAHLDVPLLVGTTGSASRRCRGARSARDHLRVQRGVDDDLLRR
ncbi:MAG TPA: MBL fold metallo-hydrolase [Solirubrobacteraceae bacterium]|nr:MBL fold metallo-hydrolase [Solirubrobacteraceae bacterium]